MTPDDLSDEEEDLMLRAVTGEIDVEGEEFTARLARSPRLRRAWTEFRRAGEVLDRAGRSDRDDLASALAEVTEVDRDQVRDVLRGRTSRVDPPPVRRARPWVWVGLAAAAAVVAVFLSRDRWTGHRGPTDGMLGTTAGVAPQGEVTAFAPFRAPDLPTWATIVFVVYDRAGVELLRSIPLEAAVWEPAPPELALLNAEGTIRWSYEVRAAGGEVLRFGGPFTASLRR